MKVLIYGNGAREHALSWKLSQSEKVEEIFSLSPNALMKKITHPIFLDSYEEIADFCRKEKVDFALIGPERPLAEGIVDVFEEHGIRVLGPKKIFASLESSKIFAKEFNKRNGIPCGEAIKVEKIEEARKAVEYFEAPYVLKADGLADGKGVLIVKDAQEAVEMAKEMLDGKFGLASQRILFEEYLEGEELSAICLFDGKTLLPLEFVRDHKRLLDGNKGPNTGGMGAYSPVKVDEKSKLSIFNLLKSVENALKIENIRYHGILYIGMILTKDGAKVLEYNVRFGDPETQALMVRLQDDLYDVLTAIFDERLEDVKLKWKGPSNVLTIASEGYPFSPKKGGKIANFDELAREVGVIVFGGAIKEKNGEYICNGGRVLSVAAVGEDAHERTLKFAERLEFPNKFYRTDIGSDER